MAVLRPCLPGSWTLVAKENGDAKTGMLGGIGFQASAEFCGHTFTSTYSLHH